MTQTMHEAVWARGQVLSCVHSGIAIGLHLRGGNRTTVQKYVQAVASLSWQCAGRVLLVCVFREQEDREERDRLRKEGKPLPPELLREGMQHRVRHAALAARSGCTGHVLRARQHRLCQSEPCASVASILTQLDWLLSSSTGMC
jgi:hypothetical protein